MEPQDERERAGNSYAKFKRKMIRRLVYVIILAAVAYGGYTVYSAKMNSQGSTGGYYGVFMDNNDVYFGKIANRTDLFVTLQNTFYLRVTQVPHTEADGRQVALSSFDLVKMGTEVHKPKDKVELQVSHIISIQELDPSSQVITTINNYKAPVQ